MTLCLVRPSVFVPPNRSLDAAGSDFSDGFLVSHDVFPPLKLRVCERFRSPADGGNAQTLAREEQRGRSRRRAGPARARARARRRQARGPFWREPCAETNRNWHRPAAHGATPTPVLRPEAASRVGEIATGTGHLEPDRQGPASGKPGRRSFAEWMFAEVNGVRPQASFQQEDSQRQTHHSCSEYLDADCHDHRGAASTGLSEHGPSCGGLSDWMVRLCRDHANASGGKNRLAEEQEGSLLPILTRNPLGDVLQLSRSSKPSSWQRTTA